MYKPKTRGTEAIILTRLARGPVGKRLYIHKVRQRTKEAAGTILYTLGWFGDQCADSSIHIGLNKETKWIEGSMHTRLDRGNRMT